MARCNKCRDGVDRHGEICHRCGGSGELTFVVEYMWPDMADFDQRPFATVEEAVSFGNSVIDDGGSAYLYGPDGKLI